MNILLANKFHYLRGGSESVYFKTAELLEKHGHKCLFFSMHHPENQLCETSNYFMPYVDLNSNTHGMISQLKSAGRILYSLDARKLLAGLLRNYHADIAHLHNIHHQISPSIIHELKNRKIPTVMTLHDYKMVCASYSMFLDKTTCESCKGGRFIEALRSKCVKESRSKSGLAALEMYLHHKVLDLYDKVDVFISPSLFLKNKLIEMGFSKEIVWLPHFIDLSKYEKISNDINDRDKLTITYFGRLSVEKGLMTLLKAAKLLDRRTDIGIEIIGDGPDMGNLRAYARDNRIKNVKFRGYMNGEKLYREIKKSTAVVIPSDWYENYPISVMEAFALGRPVIGSRIGGIPELVRDRDTGLTFETGNAEDLSGKIIMLLADDELRLNMGKNALRFVETELNADIYYHKLMQIYHRVLSH